MASKQIRSNNFNVPWKKGQKVVKIFHGTGGYKEATVGELTRIDTKTKTLYFNEGKGITYDYDGREKENFFPGMRSEIIPL